jgi:hypothetical protein
MQMSNVSWLTLEDGCKLRSLDQAAVKYIHGWHQAVRRFTI